MNPVLVFCLENHLQIKGHLVWWKVVHLCHFITKDNLFALSLFVCIIKRILWVLCLFSTHHSMIFFLLLQCHSLMFKEVEKSGLSTDDICVVSSVLTIYIELSECCVFHQRITQWWCSFVSKVIHYLFDENGKSDLLMNAFSVLFFVCAFTTQVKFCECCVCHQRNTQWCCP